MIGRLRPVRRSGPTAAFLALRFRAVAPAIVAMVALIVLVLTTVGPAQAWEREGLLPAPDAEGTYRVITRDPATTTSDCIGRPVTPLCAVETFIACRTREDFELCLASVHDEEWRKEEYSRGRYNYWAHFEIGGTRDEYAIRSVRWDGSATTPEETSAKGLPGYAKIELLRRACLDIEARCRNQWTSTAEYLVRGEGGTWRVMHWEFAKAWPELRDDTTQPWNAIVPDKAATTSRCIGNPVTPLCAIETFLACQARVQNRLCVIAVPNGDHASRIKSGTPVRMEYKIRSMHEYPSGTLWSEVYRRRPPHLSNEVMTVDLFERTCPIRNRSCQSSEFRVERYIVSRSTKRWIVTSHDKVLSPPEEEH